MPAPVAIVLIAALAVFTVVVLLYQKRKQEERTAALAAVASELGFSFSPGKDKTLTAAYGAWLFSRGGSRHARDVMHGSSNGIDASIFDYFYSEYDGENSSTTHQTVLLLKPAGDLPHFGLQPERLADRLFEKLGMGDINFDTHPEFSRLYHLKGPDEAAVRTAFTDDVLRFYEGASGLCTEVNNGAMIFYRGNRTVAPADLRDFYQQGMKAYALLRKLPSAASV